MNTKLVANRILLETHPSLEDTFDPCAPPWIPAQQWRCRWVAPTTHTSTGQPCVTVYRCVFELSQPVSAHLHVSGDERYELMIDGQFVGRGSQRGDRNNWFYESYAVELPAGRHTVVAHVWNLGPLAPWAQVRVYPGFILATEHPELVERIGTGVARWETKTLSGVSYRDGSGDVGTGLGCGPCQTIDGRVYDWSAAAGEDGAGTGQGETPVGWTPALTRDGGTSGFYLRSLAPVHIMRPATLPAMLSQKVRGVRVRMVREMSDLPLAEVGDTKQWRKLLLGVEPLELLAGQSLQVLLDMDDYHCFYSGIEVEGGRDAQITLSHSEALVDQQGQKGHRNEVSGRFIRGLTDRYIADGNVRTYRSHWWRAGRYLLLTIKTQRQPLTIRSLLLEETRYPLELEGRIDSGDQKFDRLMLLSMRTLQMCCHETYMDCPFYEQLMYVGDTRLQMLTSYVVTTDNRPVANAIGLMEASRLNFSHLVTDCYPASSGQLIPPFAFWWIAMLHDQAMWRGNRELIRRMVPAARDILAQFELMRDTSGLIRSPQGWNFIDGGFPMGVPPDGKNGISAPLNLQWVLSAKLLADLEEWLGEAHLATHWREKATSLGELVMAHFYDAFRGLVADDLKFEHYSEQTQCLAILAGVPSSRETQSIATEMFKPTAGATGAPLTRCSIYFGHYLFEVCRLTGRMELLWSRLSDWLALLDQGYRTTPEYWGNTRSDCHAWGAHPLYHYYTTILGIRPAAMGFARVEIRPQLGALANARGAMPHPLGLISVSFERQGDRLAAAVELPEGLTGVFVVGEQRIPLSSGRQQVHLPAD